MAILPGSTLGMLGGGQLGRMFVTVARTMGYEVIVLDPDSKSPAGKMASQHLEAAYDDRPALDYLHNIARRSALNLKIFPPIHSNTLPGFYRYIPLLARYESRKIEF